MTEFQLLRPEDLDVGVKIPEELDRIVRLGLIRLAPWHILDRSESARILPGLRERFAARYVPFAKRQDNDDLACLDPARPGQVLVIHDYASPGWELKATFASFWDWFRSAIEALIAFD